MEYELGLSSFSTVMTCLQIRAALRIEVLGKSPHCVLLVPVYASDMDVDLVADGMEGSPSDQTPAASICNQSHTP